MYVLVDPHATQLSTAHSYLFIGDATMYKRITTIG